MVNTYKYTKENAQNFEDTFIPYLSDLKNVALMLTRNKHDAEDLVQMCYFRAIRGYNTFIHDTNPRAWIMRILYNTFCTLKEREKKISFVDYDFSIEAQSQESDSLLPFIGEYIPAPYHTTDVKVLRQQLKECVSDTLLHALDTLPEVFSDSFIMYVIGELSYAQIAEVYKVPLGTIKSRIFRAKEELRKNLKSRADYERKN